MTRKDISRFLTDESGPTAAEYAVMLVLIIVIAIVAVRTLGSGNSSIWNRNVSTIVDAI